MKKRIISALLLSTIVLSAGASVSAVSADSSDTDAKIAQQDQTISSAQDAKAQAQAQMSSLQSSVDNLKAKQADAQAKLAATQKAADQLNAQTAKLRDSIKQRSIALQAQARDAQVNTSATNNITTVLDSKSLTDAIQKVVAMATVSGANQQMLQQQEQEEKELQAKLVAMQKNVGEYDRLTSTLASQAKDLSDQQAQLQVATINYQLTITTAQDKKDSLLAQKASAEAAAKKAEEAKAAYVAQQQAAQQQATQSESNSSSSDSSSSNSNSNSSNSNSSNSNSSNSNSSNSNSSNSNSSNSNSSNSNNNTPSNPVRPPQGGGYNNYALYNCTWYVWNYFNNNYGIQLPASLGNGADWAYSLPGTSKHVGAIVSYAGGTYIQFANNGGGFRTAAAYGHVAVVTAVYPDGSYQIYSGSTSGVDSYHVTASTPATFVSGGV
ncbi:coiled-coil domain-containing protein [Lactococcus hircilactis]|uniref:coiled-coil domain-containing protein n=1 Tax=Lactococcus hircilactis TaxID=1494462 RepID=UPI003FA2C1F1